jgi:hypothetical protein
MFGPANTNPAPQFDKAEYVGTPGEERCRFCNQPTPQQYYRVGGAMACGTCAEIARQQTPNDSHSGYMRALLLGIGAAILGLIGYAAFGILTGWVIGYLSLGVGYIVGKAMMFGSKGIGGRRYQITAVLLTYAAVSMAAIPIGISQMSKAKEKTQQEQLRDEQTQFEKENGQPPQNSVPQQPAAKKMSLGAALGSLALLGLASPFLELQNPVQGLIGLVILFVGIQIAWKITAGRPALNIEGPFDSGRIMPSPSS